MNSLPIETIRAALAYIRPDIPRDEWVKVAMAIKSELGKPGFELFNTWSQGGATYQLKSTRDAWRSVKGAGGVTIGTLLHMARESGFQPEAGAGHASWTANQQGTTSPARVDRADGDELEQAERDAAHCRAAAEAGRIWGKAKDGENCPYLARKGVRPHGVRVAAAGVLLVPMRDVEGKLWNVQRIAPAKPATGPDKRFLPGGRKSGLLHWCGDPGDASVILIAEGYATAASIHEATGRPVAVAFDAGNLVHVARELRERDTAALIVLCADDDRDTEIRTGKNPGRDMAGAAAQAVGGVVILPRDLPSGGTDFNDMHSHAGLEAVRTLIEDEIAHALRGDRLAIPTDSRNPAVGLEDWPTPQPLIAKMEPQPYPLDALPEKIRCAVMEVQGFVKAPFALVASSALATVSLAGQAQCDVRRADRLQGPSGLFLLTIADSGERKSTCDQFFSVVIRKFESEQTTAAKAEIKRHAAELSAWEAQREGILTEIKRLARKSADVSSLKNALVDLEAAKPVAPRVPRLVYGDATPEALTYSLARTWPSGGVLSSEAGAIFGSHSMGRDSIMRNLASLNELWDGKPQTFDRRREGGSYTLRGARLTVGLQVQEPTLRNFFERDEGLARGTGFLARFLVAWPKSTQGERLFTDPPASMPALAVFQSRIAEILGMPLNIAEDGSLSPSVLTLNREAKAAWVAFHDSIESQLRSGGDLHDVRDVASKAADNVARLAATFHLYEGHEGAEIGLECIQSASRIVAWHLDEARRFYGEIALPAELANAVRLDAWLIEYCRQHRTHLVPTKRVQQFGPNGLREQQKLRAALREIAELGRARYSESGRRKFIQVNPALLPWLHNASG